MSIDGNDLSKFAITARISGNTIFWTDPTDPIAKSLFQHSDNRASNNPSPSLLKGVSQSPDTKHPKHRSFWDSVKYLAGLAWKNRSTIGNVISSVMPMLAEEPGRKKTP